MIIELLEKHKSLYPFTSEELGSFVVVTGKNGTGKSQLIQLIDELTRKNTQTKIKITPNPKNLQVEGITLNRSKETEAGNLIKLLQEDYKAYEEITPEMKLFILELFDNGLKGVDIFHDMDILKYMNGTDEQDKYKRLFNYNSKLGGTNYDLSYDHGAKRNMTKMAGFIIPKKRAIALAKEVSDYKQKPFNQLDKNDFFSALVSETYYTYDTPFAVQIDNLFYGYARKRFINEINHNRKINYDADNNALPDSEFVILYPQPWKQINEILIRHNIKLRVAEIKPEDFSPEFEFNFYLIDTTNQEQIAFNDLSSGEKIIVGLIIRLFLTKRYKDELKFPDLVVLDEPDAHLHPEMSSLLLEVLYQTFVQELGIKVIITTHSPSTVALAPEDCIFELVNGPNTILKKVSKDAALKILTEKLPLLSIDYRNHRQVFVESPTDQYYYQTIFNKLKGIRKTLHDLYFITLGYGKGSCDQVIHLTTEMRKTANNSAFGLIDWDQRNTPQAFVHIHGFEKRYSLENYILDPIYLCILFIEQGCANNISELGFDRTYNQYSLPAENDSRLQQIAEWFITKIVEKHIALKNENLTEIEYADGKKLNIPLWYVTMKGHDLEVNLKATFPSLNAFRSEGDLQRKLSEIMAKCFPFVPKDSYELISNLSHS